MISSAIEIASRVWPAWVWNKMFVCSGAQNLKNIREIGQRMAINMPLSFPWAVNDFMSLFSFSFSSIRWLIFLNSLIRLPPVFRFMIVLSVKNVISGFCMSLAKFWSAISIGIWSSICWFMFFMCDFNGSFISSAMKVSAFGSVNPALSALLRAWRKAGVCSMICFFCVRIIKNVL